jgi:two-component system NtrC family response regulator
MKPTLLIVDDDEEIRSQLKWGLVKDYEIALAEDRPSALAAFAAHKPKVVLLDLGLPPRTGETVEGMATLAELLTQDGRVKVIIVSGQGEKRNALEAIGAGAHDFLCKPVDLEELKVVLRRSFHVAELERQFVALEQLRIESKTFEEMLGDSPAIEHLFASIRKVATTLAPVLILGESGTGKEMAAKAIHRLGARGTGPFVAINCGAIPEALLESELFGHERGSFTGAHAQRKGRFETAAGGTLFLDEVGELPLGLQVKLLRFLQDQTIERVGGRVPIQVDARVVAATNVDLKRATEEGRFREDLYYRLAVVVLRIPALRERQGDITLLANAFLQRFAEETGRAKLRFDSSALSALLHHHWPGNVRELENRVKRAVIMADGNTVRAEDLELAAAAGSQTPRTLKEAREAIETELVQGALVRNQGKISRAAIELGISRPTLYELMEKLGIKRDKDRDEP